MSHTKPLLRSAAREKVLHGANQVAEAIRITLGPKSKSVLIQSVYGAPRLCNDGVTIAKLVKLEDPEENLGAQMLRQAAITVYLIGRAGGIACAEGIYPPQVALVGVGRIAECPWVQAANRRTRWTKRRFVTLHSMRCG